MSSDAHALEDLKTGELLRLAASALTRHESDARALAAVHRLRAAAEIIDGMAQPSDQARHLAGSAVNHFRTRCVRVAEYASAVGSRRPRDVLSPDYDQLDRATEELINEAGHTQLLFGLVPPGSGEEGASGVLFATAKEYGRDADNERIAARRFFAVAMATAILSSGVLIWGLARLGPSVTAVRLRVFGAHLIVAFFLGIAALIVMRIGEKRGRLSSDHRRQQRQLSALDAYLAPLPPDTASLMRAVLTPRLFPRTLDDDDPLRDPVWPTPSELLEQLLKSSRPVQAPTRAAEVGASGGWLRRWHGG